MTLYKSPQCTCCEGYADYLRQNGVAVDVNPTNDLAEVDRKAGLTEAMEGCHMSFVGDYFVSGHVPVEAVHRLLAQNPAIKGITLPGMSGRLTRHGGNQATALHHLRDRQGQPLKRVHDSVARGSGCTFPMLLFDGWLNAFPASLGGKPKEAQREVCQHLIAAAALIAAVAFGLPALAQSNASAPGPHHGTTSNMHNGMSRGMMGDRMAGGCMSMMQSMRGQGHGDRPTEQWRHGTPQPDHG